MDNKLKALKQQATEASLGMERDEAAQFFSELADWAYANTKQCQSMTIVRCRIAKMITNKI